MTMLTSDCTSSPRPGRRNALPDIFQGVTAEWLEKIRQERQEQQQQEQQHAEQEQQDTDSESEYLDIVHSARFRQRRNAVVSRPDGISQLNNYHC